MLARFVLALLLAAFAMPAAAPAACHEPMPAATAGLHAMPMSDHHAPPAKATPAHGCIGCIPPSDWLSARIAAPMIAPAAAPAEIALRLDLAHGSTPMLRPPRRG